MASSAHKLIPSDPDKVMVIRKVTPEITTFSTPFSRFGKVKIGGRGTLVRMATGSLAVFSPVALTDTVKKETESQGTVKYIVAPDQEHHIFLESWHKAYPEATIVAPETLPDLRDKQSYFKLPSEKYNLFRKADKETGYKVSQEFDDEFESEYVFAHGNKELVFNHKPSKTLIEADLLFNLPATEQFSKSGENPSSGIFTKLFVGVMNTNGAATWQKRALWLQSAEDRPAFNQSMAKIQKWDFDRIIPCHGDVIETGGKGIFEKIAEWHLQAAAKK